MNERIIELSKAKENQIIAWRRELHRFPEPGGQPRWWKPRRAAWDWRFCRRADPI